MITRQRGITLEQMCVTEGFASKNQNHCISSTIESPYIATCATVCNFKSSEDISNFTLELSFPTFQVLQMKHKTYLAE